MEAELVSCDGSGLHVMMHGVDESVYHGKPYVQGRYLDFPGFYIVLISLRFYTHLTSVLITSSGDCSDINCGQGGDSWTRDVIGNNVTWHLHLSMQMLQNYDHCSKLVRNVSYIVAS